MGTGDARLFRIEGVPVICLPSNRSGIWVDRRRELIQSDGVNPNTVLAESTDAKCIAVLYWLLE